MTLSRHLTSPLPLPLLPSSLHTHTDALHCSFPHTHTAQHSVQGHHVVSHLSEHSAMAAGARRDLERDDDNRAAEESDAGEEEEEEEYEDGEEYNEAENEDMSEDDESVRQDGRNDHVDDDDDDDDSCADPAQEECSDEKTLEAMRDDNEICCRICYEVRSSLS